MKLPMKLSINRCDGSQGSWVNLEVTDEISGTTFLSLKIAFEEFAKVMTGLSLQPCQGEVRCLERLGLYEISEPRMVVFTGKRNRAYKDMREEFKHWILDNCQEEGWMLFPYLGNQDSIAYQGNKIILRYSVFKYVREDIYLEWLTEKQSRKAGK